MKKIGMFVTEAGIYNLNLLSAFAGKQTFRTFNLRVCFILKADVQTTFIFNFSTNVT